MEEKNEEGAYMVETGTEEKNPYLIGEKYPYQMLFAPPPLTGELTPYGMKNICHAIMLFASIGVWGDLANLIIISGGSVGQSAAGITISLVMTFVALIFILINLLATFGIAVSRHGTFSHYREFLLMWIYVVISSTILGITINPKTTASSSSQALACVMFFLSFYILLKGYQAFKETDLPHLSREAESQEEEDDDFLYG